MPLQYLQYLTLILVFVLFIMNYLFIQKQIKKNQSLEASIKSLLSNDDAFKLQFGEFSAGSIGMGKKTKQLELLIKKLEEGQQDIELDAPGNRMYTHAAKMVGLGATLEELMEECDLPRAEAQLVMNLHGK